MPILNSLGSIGFNSFFKGNVSPLTATSGGSYSITKGTIVTPFKPVIAGGGIGPYTYSISPALPNGLSFSTSGIVSGTPTTAFSSSYTVTITDSNNPQSTATARFTLNSSAIVTPFTFTIQPFKSIGIVGYLYLNVLEKDRLKVYVDWGDGSTYSGPGGELYHSYTNNTLLYTIKVYTQSGYLYCYPSTWQAPSTYSNPIRSIISWGNGKFYNMSDMFNSLSNTATILTTSSPDTSECTGMKRLFYKSSSFNQSVNNWNTSNVTDMSNAFYGCSVFNQPLNSWDTSNVTNMEAMFFGCSVFNQPLNSWNTSKVINMGTMFHTTGAFNQPLNSWDTSNVTNMSDMFRLSWFQQPLNSWNTSNVTNMTGMFDGGRFNQPLNLWDISKVTIMYNMFQNSYFNQPLNSWNTSNVTNMSDMFSGNTAFDQNISNWNVTKVGSRHYNFDYNTSISWTAAEKPRWVA